ncbi:hypothetical protein GQ602_003541 [Ophiocordyceps camponoti-floridani]|uniref:Hydrophobin n=1 Tax=Ophiocordyceps camponoti-floridani TaxID=2030778 RepID=A0A8H4VEL6_9HYPO|nr:hypothetical protein GQ602_003541 [Ophiocordyceps camponoti-floridani]
MKFSAVCVALSASMALANPMGEEAKLVERQQGVCQSPTAQVVLNTLTGVVADVGDGVVAGLLSPGVDAAVDQCLTLVRGSLGC